MEILACVTGVKGEGEGKKNERAKHVSSRERDGRGLYDLSLPLYGLPRRLSQFKIERQCHELLEVAPGIICQESHRRRQTLHYRALACVACHL